MADNRSLKDSRKGAVLKKQEETAMEAMGLGVEGAMLKRVIDEIYEKGGKSDD